MKLHAEMYVGEALLFDEYRQRGWAVLAEIQGSNGIL